MYYIKLGNVKSEDREECFLEFAKFLNIRKEERFYSEVSSVADILKRRTSKSYELIEYTKERGFYMYISSNPNELSSGDVKDYEEFLLTSHIKTPKDIVCDIIDKAYGGL